MVPFCETLQGAVLVAVRNMEVCYFQTMQALTPEVHTTKYIE